MKDFIGIQPDNDFFKTLTIYIDYIKHIIENITTIIPEVYITINNKYDLIFKIYIEFNRTSYGSEILLSRKYIVTDKFELFDILKEEIEIAGKKIKIKIKNEENEKAKKKKKY